MIYVQGRVKVALVIYVQGRVKAGTGDLERMKIEGAEQVQRAEKIAMETEQLNVQQHQQVGLGTLCMGCPKCDCCTYVPRITV